MTPPADADEAADVPDLPDVHEGDALVTASWWGTGLFVLVGMTALAVPAVAAGFVVVSGLLFLAGLVTFARAYLIAVQRSRESLISMGGLVFLLGCAPRRVRRHLMGAFAVQVTAAFALAWLGFGGTAGDAFNVLAVGLFAPLYGLGLAALWGAHHGVFPPRPVPPARRGGRGGPGR